MTEPPRRKQHLVSKGYQANFALAGRVAVLDARTGRVIDSKRSIKENWRTQDFLSLVSNDGVVDDTLEREFAQQEQFFLNAVRDIKPFQAPTAAQKRALDALTATHLARSADYASAHAALADSTVETAVPRLAHDERVLNAFRRDRRREPKAGELEELIEASAAAFLVDPQYLLHGIRRVSTGVTDILAGLHVQLVALESRLPGFLLADIPVLHGRRDNGVFGFREPVAVGDADIIVVPVQRRLAAFYTADRLRDLEIRTKNGWCWVNSLLVHGAATEVACHPDDALSMSRLIRDMDRYPPRKFDGVTIR